MRRFLRIAEDIADNPKLVDIEPVFVAGWTYIQGLTLATRSMTDGHINPRTALRRADVNDTTVQLRGRAMTVYDALVEQGLWHRPGHDCPRCPQPRAGNVYIHDYLEHQQSREAREELHRTKSQAGTKGADARWAKHRQGKDAAGGTQEDPQMSEAMAAAMTPAMAGGTADALAGAERTLARTTAAVPARTAPARRRTRLPETFTLSETMRAWARANVPGVDVDLQHRQFVAHYRGEGTPRDDWGEVWRAWMLRELGRANNRTRNNAVFTNPEDDSAYRRQGVRHG